jgi:predicted nuclease of predicted toxin-antitoxin system
MKLLFDQNLSPRLVELLKDVYPDSTHVSLAGLERASDEAVWTYARENSYVIVTKDADFDELNQLRGSPPKVVWLRLGNCTTDQIEGVLRSRLRALVVLEAEPEVGVLTLL